MRVSPWRVVRVAVLVAGVGVLALEASDGTRSSWPQWGGPGRDFRIPGARLASEWPADGPRRLWRRELGDGNSGIALVDGRLYTMYRRGVEEVVVALDAGDGRTLWESASAQQTWKGFLDEYGLGPHTTPLVEDGRVYAVGIGGRLRCLDAATGDQVWSRELWEAFDVGAFEYGPAQLGYSSSPLAFGDKIIAVGGGDGRAVIALDRASGEISWRSQDFPPGFASPILIDLEGDPQLVVFAADRVAGLDPEDGRPLWSHPHVTPYMVNASTPVWGPDNLLFVSSAYDTGGRGLLLRRSGSRTGVSEAWSSREVEVHHQTAVRLGDVIHASSGDFGPAFLTGVDATTGETLYKVRGFAKANLLAAGEHLLVLDEDGVLALLEVGAGEPRVLARTQLFEARSWTVPTLVDGVLYARDRREMVALDLRGGRGSGRVD
jgi:outer membrane protein assembly factor BamB